MASLVEDKQGNYLVAFRFGKRQFTRTLETKDNDIALVAIARVEETIMRLKRGWLSMPPGAEPGAFITSGGSMTTKPSYEPPVVSKAITLGGVFSAYQEQLTPNCKEANSLDTEQIHKRHLFRIMGEDLEFEKIDLEVVQQYANARTKAGVSQDTIRKELATLRMLWHWAKRLKLTPPSWEMKELTFSKAEQKEGFQTWTQIERKVVGKRIGPDRVKALWESLYMDGKQIQECLIHVRDHARHPFVYPMFVFCAYTGARRSELLRSEKDDFDFVGLRVAIRQKKHDSSPETSVM
jgi:hypothetical protein